jgi:hypothetical protein
VGEPAESSTACLARLDNRKICPNLANMPQVAASPTPTRTVAAVGRSVDLDAWTAGAEAAAMARAALPSAPKLSLVFATTGYDQEALLAGVFSECAEAKLVGCSGEGVISGELSEERDRVVTVLSIASASIHFEVLQRDDYATEPVHCGRELARAILAGGPEISAVILLTDGLTGDCGLFLTTLQQALPERTQIVGGCAGDDMSFIATYQYAGTHVLRGGVCAIVLRGAAEVRVAISHGCVPIGLERVVTDASEGWLRTIDGRPAWEVFKEYLDGNPVDLNAEGIVHLCFGKALPRAAADTYDPFLILIPTRLDSATGALFFPGGGFATGDRLRMTRRDPEKVRAGAEHCAKQLVDSRRPAFVLQFDCAGRGRILFGGCTSDEIVRPLHRVLGPGLPWIGLHTYGEIATVGARLHYHNYTVALCAVYE